MRGLKALSALLTGTLVLSACGRDSLDLGFKNQLELTIQPSALDLYIDQEFSVDVILSSPTEVRSVLGESDLTLTSSQSAVVTIGADGKGLARSPGSTTLVAEFTGLAAEASVAVRDARLTGIEVFPTEVTIATAQTTQLSVRGLLSDASTIDLSRGSSGTTYASSNQAAATVTKDGLVRGVAEGESTIAITHAGFSGTTVVTVGGTVGDCVSLSFDNVGPVVRGETRQIQVLCTTADGTQIDVLGNASFDVTLSSSDPNIASIDQNGLVSGQSVGFATLTAILGSLTTTADIQVIPPAESLVRLEVTPPGAVLGIDESVQLRVTGFYDDGSQADLTAANTGTTYTSDNPRSASVSSGGRVSAVNNGFTNITVENSGVFAFVPIEVFDESQVVFIEVIPNFLEIPVGQQRQLTVLATLSNGAVIDITFDPGTNYVAFDGFVDVNAGTVTALQAGFDLIEVTFGGFSAIVDVFVFDLNSPIVDIAIIPNFIVVGEGATTFFNVFGLLADGNIIDITFDPQLTLQSDAPRTARVAGPGVLEGVSQGDTILRARYQAFSTTADVEVTGGMQTLVGIGINIPSTIGVARSVPYSVNAFYSDGSVQDITFDPQLFVTSTDFNVLAVSPGLATGVSVGSTLVIADYQGFSQAVAVDVVSTNDPVVDLFFVPTSLSMMVGGTEFVTVIALRQSGLVEDVTNSPNLLVFASGPIQATQIPGAIVVDANGPGLGEVTANFEGFTAVLPVNVGGMPVLVGLQIIAPGLMTLNTSEFFSVFAIYSDGNFVDVSFDPGLSFSASPPNIVTVGGGSITAVAVGSTTLTALYQGFTASQQIQVVAMNDPFVSLAFVPASMNLLVGQSDTFQIFATTASGLVIDVTFDPRLGGTVSGPVNILPVVGAIEVTATGQGTGVIDVFIENVSATMIITISGGVTLTGIQLIAPPQVNVGGFETYSVLANFSDGSVQDITFDPGLIITVNDPSILGASFGTIQGFQVGSTVVVANYQGFNARARIDVVMGNDPIVGIFWNPPQLNLQVGQSQTANLVVFFQSGNTLDVTNDAATTIVASGPISTTQVPGGLSVQGNSNGTGQVDGTYQGFTAGLPVSVGNGAQLIGIRVDPSTTLQMMPGDTQQLTVVGLYSDGSEAPITGATFFAFDPAIADVSAGGLVSANAAGNAGVFVTFGNFSEFVQIFVASLMGPTITSINPDAILVGSPNTTITVTGTNFSPGDVVTVDFFPTTTTFVNSTTLTAIVPDFLLTFPFTMQVQVSGAAGTSNTVPLLVGEPLSVTSYSPRAVLQGNSIDVTAVGTGLVSLSYAATNSLTVNELATSFDGTWVRFRVTAPANAPTGMATVTLSNPFGSAPLAFTVNSTTGNPALVVNSGQIVRLSGTNVYSSVTVNTGGQIIGEGLETLAIIATGNITIRGTIDVSGEDGENGFTNPADGGNSGPGGAGGGGGGDGDAVNPASGGNGSPDGFNAQPGFGAGTPAGDGGGDGAGGGGAFGCGHGGGGGGLGGDGGSGGGDFGPGSGGFGGFSGGRGSSYGAGTGGGGASTCGSNSGGGGGGGGGGLILQVASGATILIDGRIRADGGHGGTGFSGTGGGGGGSGGRIDVIAPNGTITINDTMSAVGGDGGLTDFGDTGGGGGGGIIVVNASGGTASVNLGLLDTDGGIGGMSMGGGNRGDNGTLGQVTVTP